MSSVPVEQGEEKKGRRLFRFLSLRQVNRKGGSGEKKGGKITGMAGARRLAVPFAGRRGRRENHLALSSEKRKKRKKEKGKKPDQNDVQGNTDVGRGRGKPGGKKIGSRGKSV